MLREVWSPGFSVRPARSLHLGELEHFKVIELTNIPPAKRLKPGLHTCFCLVSNRVSRGARTAIKPCESVQRPRLQILSIDESVRVYPDASDRQVGTGQLPGATPRRFRLRGQ